MKGLCYVAIDPKDGKIVAAASDHPSLKKGVLAKDVSAWINQGLLVQLVSSQFVRVKLGECLPLSNGKYLPRLCPHCWGVGNPDE